MELQQKDQNSLHKRINDYLRGKPMTYEVEESDQETVEAMLDQLQKAEEDLRAAQERVDRLVWELDKAKS
jgi:cell division FtsZ-interacting protein ZapD